MVIWCVEMGLQMIQNSNKMKYNFYSFVLIFNVICVLKVREYIDYNVKQMWKFFENNIVPYDDFMCWNEATNNIKLE
jgi:hypothetical protein